MAADLTASYLSEARKAELKANAEALLAPGKGILAADEATPAMGQRLASIGIKENTEENRRRYRQILFATPKEDMEAIAGVILQHETCYQKNDDGVPLLKLLKDRDVIPGVTLDRGLVPLYGANEGEMTSQGLDHLDQRCAQYYADGLRFAKWRAAFSISGEMIPSELAMENNAHLMARYASACQVHGLVPIVEPDIDVINGSHSLDKATQVSTQILSVFFKVLQDYGVYLEGIVLKTSMAVAGKKASKLSLPQDVAKATLLALSRSVPPAVPGVAFLSGGQTEEQATLNLDAINRCQDVAKPWRLTFCYGRALQGSALTAWNGDDSNIKAVHQAFASRVHSNSKASLGQYEE